MKLGVVCTLDLNQTQVCDLSPTGTHVRTLPIFLLEIYLIEQLFPIRSSNAYPRHPKALIGYKNQLLRSAEFHIGKTYCALQMAQVNQNELS